MHDLTFDSIDRKVYTLPCFMTSRVTARHFIGHVAVVDSVLKTKFSVSTVNLSVTLQLMSSVTPVHFARKVVNFVGGCLTQGSMLVLC